MFTSITSSDKAIAGHPMRLTLRYTHEGEALPQNARLRIGYNIKDGAMCLQRSDPAAPGYISLSTRATAVLGIDDNLQTYYRSITFFPATKQCDLLVFSIAVLSGTITAGDSIDISLGSCGDNGGSFVAGTFADSPLEFFFSLDRDNRFAPKSLHPDAPQYTQFISTDGQFFPAWQHTGIEITVTPDDAISADLTLPSFVKKDEETCLRIVVYDDHGNHIRDYRDDITIIETDGVNFRKTSFDTGPDGFALVPVSFSKEQIYAGLKFRLGHLGIIGANPVAVGDSGTERIFWGEMHGHSCLSDGGVRGPDSFFAYARDIRGLDFAALADHSFGLAVSDHWDKLQQSVRDFYVKDCFVSILGYEIMTSCNRQPTGMGHRNLYFPDDAGTLAMADYQPGSGGSFAEEDIEAYKDIWNSRVAKTPTIEEFFNLLAGQDFLWTAHHCGNIDAVEENLLDLYEACSEWGISDDIPRKNKCTTMLETVFKGSVNPGLFGNSDDHAAKAAAKQTAIAGSPLRYPSGLTAVFAAALDRDSVYSALKRKYCYATTGARMLIIPQIELHVNTLDVKLQIAGTARLDKIWIYKNGAVVLETLLENVFRVHFDWCDENFGEDDNCYLRISQSDGEMAWINILPFGR